MSKLPSHISPKSDRSIFYGFLFLVMWLPLPVGSNRPWAWHLMEVIVFSLCVWWCVLFLKEKVKFSVALKHSQGLFICLGCFMGASLLQLLPLPVSWIASLRAVDFSIETISVTTVAIDSYHAWMHLRLTLAFSVLAFLMLALVNTPTRLRQFAIALLISGILQAVYGSFMTLSGIEYGFLIKKWTYMGYATGTFVNRNHLANYLILCLSMGTGLLLSDLYHRSSKSWSERGQRIIGALLGSKLLIRIGLALMVIALVLTRSRMGNTAFFLSLLFSGFVWLWLTKRITKGSIILLMSLILIDTFIVGTWFGIDKVKERLENTALSTETRDEVNLYTWAMIKDQPLLGSGAGSYYTAFPRYRKKDVTIYYDHAHNDYLQFLSEYGFLGVLPLFTLVLLSLKHSIVAMRKRKTLLFQALGFAPLMSITAMAMHSAVDFSLQIPANAATFVLVLSMAWLIRYMPAKMHHR